MKEENFAFKAEMYFAKNWKFIFWGLILIFLVGTWELHKINTRMENLEKVVYENNSKVVLTTTDGRAIKVTKTPLQAERLKEFAVSTLVNNLIVSRASLTDNFKISSFVKPADILRGSQNLGLIWKEFIDQQDRQIVGEYTSYINWLISAIATDKLPEYIQIRSYKVDKYETLTNGFDIEIDVLVSANSYILSLGKYVNSNGNIKIVAKGNFNLEKSTDYNPYGMKFTSLRIKALTKGDR